MYRFTKQNGHIATLPMNLTDICASQIASALTDSPNWKAELSVIKHKLNTHCFELVLYYLSETKGLLEAIRSSKPISVDKRFSVVSNNGICVARNSFSTYLISSITNPDFSRLIDVEDSYLIGITSDGDSVVFIDNQVIYDGWSNNYCHKQDSITYYNLSDSFASKYLLDCDVSGTMSMSGNFLTLINPDVRIVWDFDGTTWQCISDVRFKLFGFITEAFSTNWNRTGIIGSSGMGWFDKLLELNPFMTSTSDFRHSSPISFSDDFKISPSQRLIIIPHYMHDRNIERKNLLICDWTGQVHHRIENVNTYAIDWPMEDRILLLGGDQSGMIVTIDITVKPMSVSIEDKFWFRTSYLLGRTICDNTGRYVFLTVESSDALLYDMRSYNIWYIGGVANVFYLFDNWFVITGRVSKLRKHLDVPYILESSTMEGECKLRQLSNAITSDSSAGKGLMHMMRTHTAVLLVNAATMQIHAREVPSAVSVKKSGPYMIIDDTIFDGRIVA